MIGHLRRFNCLHPGFCRDFSLAGNWVNFLICVWGFIALLSGLKNCCAQKRSVSVFVKKPRNARAHTRKLPNRAAYGFVHWCEESINAPFHAVYYTICYNAVSFHCSNKNSHLKRLSKLKPNQNFQRPFKCTWKWVIDQHELFWKYKNELLYMIFMLPSAKKNIITTFNNEKKLYIL